MTPLINVIQSRIDCNCNHFSNVKTLVLTRRTFFGCSRVSEFEFSSKRLRIFLSNRFSSRNNFLILFQSNQRKIFYFERNIKMISKWWKNYKYRFTPYVRGNLKNMKNTRYTDQTHVGLFKSVRGFLVLALSCYFDNLICRLSVEMQ